MNPFKKNTWSKSIVLASLLGNTSIIEASAPNSLGFSTTNILSLYGQGFYQEDTHIFPIQKDPQALKWQDSILLETNNLSSIRILDADSGIWSLLPSSKLKLQSNENQYERSVLLEKGSIRLRSSGDLNEKIISTNDSFTNKAIIYTSEMKIIVPRASDVVVYQEKDLNGKSFTTVITLGGVIYLEPREDLLKKSKLKKLTKIKLNPGLEFIINSDGIVKPLSQPNKQKLDTINVFTTTKKDLEEQKENAKYLDLNTLLDQCIILTNNEEYFEVISLLESFKDSSTKDARLSYCLGAAYKGLYQLTLARKYLTTTTELDPNFSRAHWLLALIDMEEKNYTQAETRFNIAKEHFSNNEALKHDYNYYMGVNRFYAKNLLDAKPYLTTAVLDYDLDPSMRQSAASFLSQIKVDKPWNLVVPFVLQYDSNVLSLAQNQSLPAQYNDKADWRSIIGALYDYDPSKSSTNNDWFLGYSAKTFYVKNLTQTYKNLDAIVVEGSITETRRRGIASDFEDKYKLYESAGLISVDYKADSYYSLFGTVYRNYELNIGYEWDVSDRADDYKKTGAVFNQYYTLPTKNTKLFNYDLSLQGQEKILNHTSFAVGNSVEFFATPSLTYAFNTNANIKAFNTFDFLWTFTSSSDESIYKFIPTLSGSYFLTRSLLSNLSLYYEFDINYPGADLVLKPGASFSLTGIF